MFRDPRGYRGVGISGVAASRHTVSFMMIAISNSMADAGSTRSVRAGRRADNDATTHHLNGDYRKAQVKIAELHRSNGQSVLRRVCSWRWPTLHTRRYAVVAGTTTSMRPVSTS